MEKVKLESKQVMVGKSVRIPINHFDNGFNVYQSAVYLCLLYSLGINRDENIARISYNELSRQLGISSVKAKNVIRELELLGFVDIIRGTNDDGGHQTNGYVVYAKVDSSARG